MAFVLNDDLVHEIFRRSSIHSLLSLSLVSTRFHAASVPHLVREVSLAQSPEQVQCFLRFIIDNTQLPNAVELGEGSDASGISGPGKHVISFEIRRSAFDSTVEGTYNHIRIEPEPRPVESWASTLTKALALMPNLRSFAMFGSGNTRRIFSHSPDFAMTLMSRLFLEELSLSGLNDAVSTAIGKAMQSRNLNGGTRFKKLAFYRNITTGDPPVLLVRTEGIGSLISHCRDSLEVLELTDPTIQSFLYSPGETASSDGVTSIEAGTMIFPNVVRFAWYFTLDISLDSLNSSFPSLKNLDLGYYTAPHPDHEILFKKLRSVGGSYSEVSSFLQCIALPDRIQRLDLRYLPTLDADNHLGISRVASGLKSLHVENSGRDETDWWKFFHHSFSSLTYLSVSFVDMLTEHIGTMNENLPPLLASVPLEYVSVLIIGHPIWGQRPSDFETFTMTEDEVAMRYAEHVKTLKFVDVYKSWAVDPDCDEHWHYWRIIREDSPDDGGKGVQLEALDAADGKAWNKWYDDAAFRD